MLLKGEFAILGHIITNKNVECVATDFVVYAVVVVVLVVMVVALGAEVLTHRGHAPVCPVSGEAPPVPHCPLFIFGYDCN